MKKIAFAIAFKDFRDEEYFIPKQIFKDNGFSVKTFSNEKGIAIGILGGEAKIDFLLKDLNVDDFDALVFAGGGGAMQFLNNEISYTKIKEADEKGKIIAAICIAPVILAKAGVLENKNCTVWSSIMDKSAIETLKEFKGKYKENRVVIDKNIVTACGPEAAQEFAEEIAKLLQLS